jgi:predicted nucleotide-binding protein (sugar kinase/HSP70/actin superfamily)
MNENNNKKENDIEIEVSIITFKDEITGLYGAGCEYFKYQTQCTYKTPEEAKQILVKNINNIISEMKNATFN